MLLLNNCVAKYINLLRFVEFTMTVRSDILKESTLMLLVQ